LVLGARDLEIRPYSRSDHDELLVAYAQVVADGGAFPREPPADEQMLETAWLDGKSAVLVARLRSRFAGSYFLQANFPGTGSHVANAGYLVARELRRRGIGGALLEHSLEEARRLGYTAMMFNHVFESNPSRRLWERMGFEIVGRIPRFSPDGESALIYWRAL
jgi:ribosomal protein S18 acetylase RimI-like enzyme